MEKIVLKFSVQHCFNMLSSLCVTLTMDENGKQFSIENHNPFAELNPELQGIQNHWGQVCPHNPMILWQIDYLSVEIKASIPTIST